MNRLLTSLALAAFAFVAAAPAASAMKIEKIVTPAGITAWLVREHTVPLISLNYAFRGGSSQDEADKSGTASLAGNLLDEGAGSLDSEQYHDRLERHAISVGFQVGRDYFRGTLRTLTEHQDEAFDLLNLALTKPRFDANAVVRVRGQVMAGLRRQITNPNDVARLRWWRTAFPGHPYGRQTSGSLETVPRITVDDMRGYVRNVFARDGLTVSIVGNVDAKTAAKLVDRAFGNLPAKSHLKTVPQAVPVGLGKRIVMKLNVPQSVVTFGGKGIERNDPDFMAAYIVNHILGGGDFSSRLYKEVREKRGLTYGVQDSLVWFQHAAVVIGGTATRDDRTADALKIIEQQIGRMAKDGPTAAELAPAKSYLKGAYALSLDSSRKIAAQLTQMQLDHLGMDYIQRRGAMIDGVTLADAKRVAKRLYGGGILVTV
ncbi:MAG: pitrilysin family protein, partial [Pseudolabrys sp.]